MRRILMIAAALLVIAAAAVAAPPDDLARLQAELATARYARVGLADRTVSVARPQPGPAGLAHAGLVGRSALIVIPDRDARTPNPIPWSAIDRIELGRRDHSRWAVRGGLAGGAIGLAAAGLLVPLVSMEGDVDVRGIVVTTTVGGTLLGAVFGALIAPTRWRTVHPMPGS